MREQASWLKNKFDAGEIEPQAQFGFFVRRAKVLIEATMPQKQIPTNGEKSGCSMMNG